jgi:N-acetylglucosaminyldiphosphoundecaprenol N-acetyl-beta-D-mannosaminyltransferase
MSRSQIDLPINESAAESLEQSDADSGVPQFDRFSFMDISINCLSLSDLMNLVKFGIEKKKKWVIGNHNLHSLYLFHKSPALRQFFSIADWVHVDGMPIVALARLFGHPINREHRVTYADWTGKLMEGAAQNGWRVFYLGSEEATLGKALLILRAQYPGLLIEGRNGFFNVATTGVENRAVLDAIAAYQPNLLMIGMSMPRQEIWINANLEEINANVILPSGAAIAYVAGQIPTPPRWAGKIGLEWAFRLAAEPRRLASRYLIEPWSILRILLYELAFQRGKQ